MRNGIPPETIVRLLHEANPHREMAMECWQHSMARTNKTVTIWCALGFEDQDDLVVRDARGEPCARKPWQRKNVILGFGPDLAKVLWEVRRGDVARMRRTLWYDIVARRFLTGPCAERVGLSGRPVWAPDRGQV